VRKLQRTIFDCRDDGGLLTLAQRAIFVGIVNDHTFVEFRRMTGDTLAGRTFAFWRRAFATARASRRAGLERPVLDGFDHRGLFRGIEFGVLVRVVGCEGCIALTEMLDDFGGGGTLAAGAARTILSKGKRQEAPNNSEAVKRSWSFIMWGLVWFRIESAWRFGR
jgi:hypothetical protein